MWGHGHTVQHRHNHTATKLKQCKETLGYAGIMLRTTALIVMWYTLILSALFIHSPFCLKPSEVAVVIQVNSERLQCVPLAFIRGAVRPGFD